MQIIVHVLFICGFSLIWNCHNSEWKAPNFDLFSALRAIEQQGFYSVQYLLWHGTSVYNGHLRGPVTLTPYTYCRTFGSGAVTTTYHLGLSRLVQGTCSSKLTCLINCYLNCLLFISMIFLIFGSIVWEVFPCMRFQISICVHHLKVACNMINDVYKNT